MNYTQFTPEDFDYLNTEGYNEEQIQEALVAFYRKFIKPYYPDCFIICNPWSEENKPAQWVNKAKSKGFEKGQPDLIFIQPSIVNGMAFCGLAIELKKDGQKIFKRNGTPKNDHIKEQKRKLDQLKVSKFFAHFGLGYGHSLFLIKKYFDYE